MVTVIPFSGEGWHAPAGRRTWKPRPLAQARQIRPAAPVGARNWDPAGKPVTGQPQRRRPDRRSGRVPGSDATPEPPRNRVSKTRVEASLILPAVMVGQAAAESAVRSDTEWALFGSNAKGDHAHAEGSEVGAAGDLAFTGKPSGRPGLARIVPTRRGSGTALPMRTGAVPRSRGRRHPTTARCGRRCQRPGSCRLG